MGHIEKEKHIKIFFLAAILLVLAFTVKNSKEDHFKKLSAFLKKEDVRITQEHKAAHNYLEVQKIKNKNVYKDVHDIDSDPDDFVLPKTPYGVALEDENFAKKVSEDLNKIDNDNKNKRFSPEYSVSREIADDLYIDERQYETQKAYVEAFLSNARKAGYEIELNENLEVVDVRRVLEKQPMRFPQSNNPQAGKIKGSN